MHSRGTSGAQGSGSTRREQRRQTGRAAHLAKLCCPEHGAGSQLLHDWSPCFHLTLHAANATIVEAVGDHRAVQIVDFDVSAPQHAALTQYVATAACPEPLSRGGRASGAAAVTE
ncbi:hypothetical protein PR202_ga13529 [Eleusine coracana subsp. coracana]|uniref:Uncharacterized protein n=1 Tax=Eleusine coracana subsp. coracana TaxID=191504 RepID=A0AAV5CE93_ELECO|nr:hypothetical protein PR202_ga13529 [Eleusine coracana subsp. coracana]